MSKKRRGAESVTRSSSDLFEEKVTRLKELSPKAVTKGKMKAEFGVCQL